MIRRAVPLLVLLASLLFPDALAAAISGPLTPVTGSALTALIALLVVAVGGRPWLRSATLRATPGQVAPSGTAGQRDLKIDFLRGLAISFVVVDHIDLPSLYHLISHERISVVSGAELFVTLSGVVLGMLVRRRAGEGRWLQEAGRVLGRARALYLVALVVALSAYLLSLIPGTNGAVLTSWTDPGTGATYPLYAHTESVPRFLANVLLLNYGPWQFNVMGLYVVLLLLTPLIQMQLLGGRVLLVLGASWALYLVQALHPLKLLPTQFEDPFRLLAWQLLFVHGLCFGYYRQEVLRWMHTRAGRAVGAAAVLAFAALLLFTWNNPGAEKVFGFHLTLIPAGTFSEVYRRFFSRPELGIGRVLNLAAFLIVAYALLDRFWPLFQRTLGWLLVPLGQATLYVFILHVYLVYVVSSLPLLRGASAAVNTLVHTAVLLLLWLMVKRRFLFRWIPR